MLLKAVYLSKKIGPVCNQRHSQDDENILSVVLHPRWLGASLIKVILLSIHRKKVPGSSPGWDGRPFCVEFACFPCVSAGLLWFPPTAQRHAG